MVVALNSSSPTPFGLPLASVGWLSQSRVSRHTPIHMLLVSYTYSEIQIHEIHTCSLFSVYKLESTMSALISAGPEFPVYKLESTMSALISAGPELINRQTKTGKLFETLDATSCNQST